MSDEMLTCPYCGKDNLPQAMRCIHCGKELEILFYLGNGEPEDLYGSGADNKDGLPEMLKDLREASALGNFPQDQIPEHNELDETPETELTSENKVPDWLSRIRERARTEKNVSGDFVKSINAMDEARSKSKTVEEEFDALIARLQERQRQEKLERARAAEPSPLETDGTPVWLQRVRDLQLKPDEPKAQESVESTNEDHQESKKWDSGWTEEDLEKLRRGEWKQPAPEVSEPATSEEAEEISAPEPIGETLAEPEIEHNIADIEDEPVVIPLPFDEQDSKPEPGLASDDAGVLPEIEEIDSALVGEELTTPEPDLTKVKETVTEQAELLLGEAGMPAVVMPLPEEEKPEVKNSVPDLLLLRSQKDRADLLKNLIAEEFTPSMPIKPGGMQSKGWGRLILSLILLVALVSMILIGGSKPSDSLAPRPPARAFADRLDQLNADKPILVVLDYQAGTSAEMEALAQPVMQSLVQKGMRQDWLAVQPTGLWLAQKLQETFSSKIPVTKQYLAGGKLALLNLSVGIQPYLRLPQIPGILPEDIRHLNDYQAMLILSDSAEDVRYWIEQASMWMDPGKILVVSAEQSRVMLMPYYQTGQLGGYVAGLTDITDSAQTQSPLFNSFGAYQAGMLVMILALLLGMLSKADEDARKKHNREEAA